MTKKTKILVTGSAGFIGSHLYDQLFNMGHQVYGVDDLSGGFTRNVSQKKFFTKLDLRGRAKTAAYIKKIKPEIIFHLAADATEGRSQFTPFSAIDRNIVAYTNLLVPAIKYGLKKMILTSSMSVYGKQQVPFHENMIPQPEDIYGMSKAGMEKMTEVMSKVYGFKYVIIRPHNCYDDQTEVLTQEGFKLFKNLKKDDLIATLNSKTHYLEYHKAYAWQKISYKGDILQFDSKSYDLSVTPDHKMFVKKTPKSKYEFIPAETLTKLSTAYSARLKCSANGWIGEDRRFHILEEEKDELGRSMLNNHQRGWSKIIPMELWCQFLGWYISEGSRFKTKSNYVISISQYESVNRDNREEIIEIIKKMGFIPYTTNEKEIRIFSRQLYRELNRLQIGKSKEKLIPSDIKNLDVKYLTVLYDSLMKGDGNKSGRRYTTNSKQLTDDFVELCLKLGKSTTVHNDNSCYRISISDKNEPQLGDNRKKKVYVKKVPYNGYVYDITVPNHIIFVRRNGKASWSSNCYGPRQNLSDPYRNVVGIFINSLLHGRNFYIYGDGTQKRAFSYIDDVAPAMVKSAFSKRCEGKVINIGSDEVVFVKDLARIVLEEFFGKNNIPAKFKPKNMPDRPQEVKYAYCIHTEARRLLNFKAETRLRDGVGEMIKWARELGKQPFAYLDSLDLEHPNTPETWKDKLI